MQQFLESSHEIIVLLGLIVWSLDGFEWVSAIIQHKVSR